MNLRVLLTSVLPAVLLHGCDAPRPDAAASFAPNVLLISIDTLRPDHLGGNGYPRGTAPTIGRLARRGVRFAQAVSTTSWTLPAHAALFTGLYDSAHGVVRNGLRLADAQITLAEVLRDHGWQTAGFFGGPYLHPFFGVSQGFETYRNCMSEAGDEAGDTAPRGDGHGDVTGPRTVEEFRRWLHDADERPFFAFVHLWDVHYDFIPPPVYRDYFDPEYAGTLTGVDFLRNPRISRRMDPRDRRHLMALYDGEIRFTDDSVAEILAELEAKGRMQDTIVIVTGDHGEEFFEHGHKGHQRTLFDEVVRVPLVFHWEGRLGPAAAGGSPVRRDQVRLVDVMPTVLSLCGIEETPAMNGRDLTPLLRGGSLPPEPALCELYAEGREVVALREEETKMLRSGADRPVVAFDLTVDPGEREPVPLDAAEDGPDLADRLEEELSRARESGAGRAAVPVEDVAADLEERLRSLGYVGSDS